MSDEFFQGLVEEMMITLQMAQVKWHTVDIDADILRSD